MGCVEGLSGVVLCRFPGIDVRWEEKCQVGELKVIEIMSPPKPLAVASSLDSG